jgi:hypothetical protein
LLQLHSGPEQAMMTSISEMLAKEANATQMRVELEATRLQFEREKWAKEMQFQHELKLKQLDEDAKNAELLREKERIQLKLIQSTLEK